MATQSGLVVSSAEFVRRFGAWQDRANSDPVFVTHHGRRRHVMLSVPVYETLLAATRDEGPTDGDALRLETLIGQMDAAFVALNADQTISVINPAACAYFGKSQQSTIGQPIGPDFAEFERSVVRAHLSRTLASGEIASFEMPAITHPGEWLRCAIFPYGDGVACLFRNITGEHNAVAADQASESLNAAITAAGGIGCGKLSLRGTFSEVGTQLAALAGFQPHALEQVRLTDILPLGRRVEAAAHIEAVLSSGEVRGFSSSLLVNKGGELPVRIGLAPLRGDYAIDGVTVVIASGSA